MTNKELVVLIKKLDPEAQFGPEEQVLESTLLLCAAHIFIKQYKETSDVNRFRKQLDFYLRNGKLKTEEDI